MWCCENIFLPHFGLWSECDLKYSWLCPSLYGHRLSSPGDDYLEQDGIPQGFNLTAFAFETIVTVIHRHCGSHYFLFSSIGKWFWSHTPIKGQPSSDSKALCKELMHFSRHPQRGGRGRESWTSALCLWAAVALSLWLCLSKLCQVHVPACLLFVAVLVN